MSSGKFWGALKANASKRPQDVFGDCLKEYSRSSRPVVPFGDGNRCRASLGLLWPCRIGKLWLRKDGKPLVLADLRCGEEPPVEISVNEIRLHYRFLNNAYEEYVARLNRRLKRSASPLLVGIGLTGTMRGFYWVQITNIFFEEEPLWYFGRSDCPGNPNPSKW